jgi:hypothetical protein
MATLGLLPPYTLEDVKRAYLDKVRTAHPDHGGAIEDFRLIQDAYEEAQRYVEFRSNKRSWIAAQMDRYLAFQELEAHLKRLGADVVIQQTDWLQKSYGDFAELTASVQSIRLVDSPAGQEVMNLLVVNRTGASSLKRLELMGCGLTDEAVLSLSCFQLLEYLDLSRNKLTKRVTALADAIPQLSVFRLNGTSVGLWDKMKLSRVLSKRSK